MPYDSQGKFFLQLLADYTLVNEMLVGSSAKLYLKKLGIKYGYDVEDRYRTTVGNKNTALSREEFIKIVVDLLNQLGGQVQCRKHTESKVEFVEYKCPFGYMTIKSPALCEVIKGMIGGIGARNFPHCKISAKQVREKGDSYCLLNVFWAETAEAEESPGEIYPNDSTSYFLTRKDIETVSEGLLAESSSDSQYLQGLEDLKLAHREMETEYNQLLDEIFSDLKLGVLTVNNKNQITYLNKTAQELLRPESQWDSAPGKAFREILEETLTQKKRFNQHMLQLIFQDGVQYISVNASPLFDAEGNVSGAVSVFQDVTENKTVENELIQMEKFSLVAELAAGTAHEIRNPMTTLRGFLQILCQEFRPDSKGYEYCELMIEEIDRANSIIKEFLLLTKPTALNLKKTDLHLILEEIFLLIESKSLLESVEIQKEYAKESIYVQAVPAQIKQVFLNLATNAIHAMPSGGRLTIATRTKKDKAVISFSDTGCGIEENQLTKVFDPFYTTKENGTGLGLTISYGIIENHQGRIYVDSIPGKGTTFTIELPIIKNELQQ